MSKKNVCDFCLKEAKGLFGRHEELADGHYICKDCKSLVQSYGLKPKFDIFQMLVTAQENMRNMIMDVYMKDHEPDEVMAAQYPWPEIPFHEGEHCINAVKASYTVRKSLVPQEFAVKTIAEVRKGFIHNIPDATERSGSVKIDGMLYETEVAIYFISENIINVHRLGYWKRNNNNNTHIVIQTPSKKFTYTVEHADMFYLRERFFRKLSAYKSNKTQHLIYISDDNKYTITPGVYDIPKSLKPGVYKVKAINDAGLHMRDPLGRVTDYYETEDFIDLAAGGVLECTGEYKLEWVGESK